MNFKKFFNGKRVIVTGHTGFKGSWLTLWLYSLGAKILGISKDIPTKPSHYLASSIFRNSITKNHDIRDLKSLKKIFKKYQPDFVFHLAAQSLIKKSYIDPVYTWETNLIGTLNVLEALREIKKKTVAIIITSDKSYKNLELKRGYKENDLLGGKDPYSASKASAEFAIQSYVNSFFPKKNSNISIGVARAGNVIGGGDWSSDRLIPDCIRSWSKGKKVIIRNPRSTRPWQHVLEAISGYLHLAISLKKNQKIHGEAFNFGPQTSKELKVINLVKLMRKKWKKVSWKTKSRKNNFFESNLLKLDSTKAKKLLNWNCILNFDETIFMVVDWYKTFYTSRKNMQKISLMQIDRYQNLLNLRKKK